MPGNIIGSAYVRIRALTNGLDNDIKKALDKQYGDAGKSAGDKFNKALNDSVKNNRIDTSNMIDESGIDSSAKNISKKIKDTFKDANNKVEIDVTASKEGIRDTKHDIDDIFDEYDGKNLTIDPDLNTPATTRVSARLAWLARTRFVSFVANVDSKSVATAVAALSGLRVIGSTLTSLWDSFKNLDKHILKIGAMATALTYLGGAATALTSNVSTLIYGLMQIAGAATPLVGILGGVGMSIWALVLALKDAPTYLSSLSTGFANLQASVSGAFWQNAADPILNLVNTVLPSLNDGLTRTGASLGAFTASLASAFTASFDSGTFSLMFANLTRSIDIASKSTGSMAESLAILGRHGSEYLPRLANWWVDINAKFTAFLTKAESDGSLQRWTDVAIQNLSDLGGVLSGATRILWNFGQIAAEAGGSSLATLNNGINGIADAISRDPFRTTMVNVLSSAHELLSDIGYEVGPAVSNFFVAFGGTVTNVFRKVGTDIGTVFKNLFDSLGSQSFLSSFESALSSVISGLAGFSAHLPAISGGLSALLSVVGTLGASLLPVLGQALATVADTLVLVAPTVNTLITGLSSIVGVIAQVPGPVLLAAGAFLLLNDKWNLGGKAGESFRRSVSTLSESMSTVSGHVSRATGSFGDYATKIMVIQATSGTAAAASTVMGTAISKATGFVKGIGNAIKTAFLSNPVGLIITGIATALSIMGANAQESQARIDGLKSTLDQTTGAMTSLTDKAIADSFVQNNSTMVEAAQMLGISLGDLVAAYKGEAPEVIQHLKDNNLELADAMREVEHEFILAGVMQSKFFGILENGSKDIERAAAANENYATVTAKSSDSTKTAAERLAELKEKYGEAASKIMEQVDAIGKLIAAREKEAGVQRNAVSSYIDLLDSLDAVNKMARETGDIWDDNRDLIGNLDNAAIRPAIGSLLDLSKGAIDTALSMDKAKYSTEQIKAALQRAEDGFFAAAAAMGIPREAAEELGRQIGILPGETELLVTADTNNALLSIGDLLIAANSSTGTISINGETHGANVALGELFEKVKGSDGKWKVVIDGNAYPAELTLRELAAATDNTELMLALGMEPDETPEEFVARTQASLGKVPVPFSPEWADQPQTILDQVINQYKPVVDINGNKAPFDQQVADAVNSAIGSNPTMNILGNNSGAIDALGQSVASTTGANPVMTINGNNVPAINALNSTNAAVNGSTPNIGIGAITSGAAGQLSWINNQVTGSYPNINIGGINQGALNAINYATNAANSANGTIDINGNNSGAKSAATEAKNYANSLSATIKVYAQKIGFNSQMTAADGAIVAGASTFAGGGVRYGENHRATMARANGRVRIWAEPETGGEAYIPLAKSKRKASLALWQEVGKIFGVTGESFADGGSRGAESIRSASRGTTSSAAPVQNVYNIEISAKDLVGLKTVEQMISMFRNNARQGRELG